MKCIQGNPRNQWEMYCLDAHVDADNEVCRIDLFGETLSHRDNMYLQAKKNDSAEINRFNLSILCGESFICGE
jgi:hypothetical protein